jgi:hypothetical protein
MCYSRKLDSLFGLGGEDRPSRCGGCRPSRWMQRPRRPHSDTVRAIPQRRGSMPMRSLEWCDGTRREPTHGTGDPRLGLPPGRSPHVIIIVHGQLCAILGPVCRRDGSEYLRDTPHRHTHCRPCTTHRRQPTTTAEKKRALVGSVARQPTAYAREKCSAVRQWD